MIFFLLFYLILSFSTIFFPHFHKKFSNFQKCSGHTLQKRPFSLAKLCAKKQEKSSNACFFLLLFGEENHFVSFALKEAQHCLFQCYCCWSFSFFPPTLEWYELTFISKVNNPTPTIHNYNLSNFCIAELSNILSYS